MSASVARSFLSSGISVIVAGHPRQRRRFPRQCGPGALLLDSGQSLQVGGHCAILQRRVPKRLVSGAGATRIERRLFLLDRQQKLLLPERRECRRHGRRTDRGKLLIRPRHLRSRVRLARSDARRSRLCDSSSSRKYSKRQRSSRRSAQPERGTVWTGHLHFWLRLARGVFWRSCLCEPPNQIASFSGQ
jgi:hypothetical protein